MFFDLRKVARAMDYKEEIIKLLNNVPKYKLKVIYAFVKKYLS